MVTLCKVIQQLIWWHLSLHLCLYFLLWTNTQRVKSQTEQREKRERKKHNQKTISLPFFAFSLCLSFCLFLLSLLSSNNSKIKLHYTSLHWSFSTFRTSISAGQRRKWLMSHGVLIESFLFGQIILTMWPLNSIIAQNGILNSFECYWCF